MRLIALAVLLLVVAGCTPKTGNGAQPASTAAPVPKDRDETAVITALRHLDACALIEPGATQPKAPGPHRCSVEKAGDTLSVALGIRFDRARKYPALPLDLDGSRAYLEVAEPGNCLVAIPVSFNLSIAIIGRTGARTGPGDGCEPAKSAATAAIRRMPTSATAAASTWTACELLANVLGHSTGLSVDDSGGLDRCTASDRGKPLFQANLDYGDDPTTGAANVRTVAGQRVAVLPGCEYRWITAARLVVRFHADDCAQGDPLVEKLINTLATANRERAAPQNPLPIRTDEPDQPVAGACVDFPDSTNCQPSTPAAVPQGADPALRAAAGDARVACALSADAIHTNVGPTLAPVLASRTDERPRCYFVEPAHTTILEVSVEPDGALPAAGSDRTVAGRPGKVDTNRVCVLAVPGAKTGLLCVTATFLRGRGKERYAAVDTSAAGRVEPAVTAIVSRYFS